MNPNKDEQKSEPEGFEALLNQNEIAEKQSLQDKDIKPIEERIRESAPARNESIVRSLRTFKGDVDESIATGKTTLVGIAAAEAARQSIGNRAVKLASSINIAGVKKIALYLAGVFLIILGIGGAYYIYTLQSASQTVSVNRTELLVPVEKTETIDATNLSTDEFRKALIAARTKASGQIGILVGILSTETKTGSAGKEVASILTTQEFFGKAKLNPPGKLLRSLNPEYLYGIHIFDGNQPFMVLKSNSYETSFAGMLEWEQTLGDEIGPLFQNQLNAVPLFSGTSTIPVPNPQFADIVYKNIDVRALKNNAGKIVVVYAFPTRDTLIIASNPETIGEILTRLTNTKIVQ